jgi:Domain of unknown function (DUF4397)
MFADSIKIVSRVVMLLARFHAPLQWLPQWRQYMHQRMKQSRRPALMTAILFITAFTLAGCGKNSSNTDGELRVLHLAPESGNLSVRVDDETSNWQSDIGFKQTTAFKSIGESSRRFRVSNSGGVILDSTFGVATSAKQMLVIYGGASSVGMTLLKNDISSSSSGKSKLRLISYGVGLGTFDLYMTTASEDYRSVEPKQRNTSGTTYEIDTGTYTVRLTSPNTKDILFEMPARSFDDRKYYNLVLYNEGSAELPNAFWLTQDDTNAPELLTSTVSRVRAINSQATFPTVSVNIGSTRVFTTIPFGGISSFARTASGNRVVSFAETTNGNTVGSVSSTLVGGRDYSAFLAPSGAGAAAFIVLDRNFPPSSGKVRVRLVNASSAADLALALSFSPISPSIGVQQASNYFEVNAGDGTPVTITQGAANTPVLNLSGTDLSAGRTYTFVVSGVPGALGLAVRQDN